jgi:hypothetical protein
MQGRPLRGTTRGTIGVGMPLPRRFADVQQSSGRSGPYRWTARLGRSRRAVIAECLARDLYTKQLEVLKCTS